MVDFEPHFLFFADYATNTVTLTTNKFPIKPTLSDSVEIVTLDVFLRLFYKLVVDFEPHFLFFADYAYCY